MSGTGTTVAVSAGVSAVVTAVVGTLLNWGGRVVAFIKAHVPPDHAALYGQGWALSSPASGTDQLRVLVVCAPSRSLHHQTIDPDRAIAFVREEFAGLFPTEPVFSMPSYGVRFEVGPSLDSGYVWVNSTGRVDLSLPIALKTNEEGEYFVPLIAILEPISRLARAIDSKSYVNVFDKTRTRIRRKFDWYIGVSSTVVVPEFGSVSWNDVEFPGRRPDRAGMKQQANCPMQGFAAAALRSWRPRRPIKRLLDLFLTDFLAQNGYHNCTGAIADTLAAFAANVAQSPKHAQENL